MPRVVRRLAPGSTSIRAEAVYRLPGLRPVTVWEIAAVAVPESSALLRPWSSVSRTTVPVFVHPLRPRSLKPGSSTPVPWPQSARVSLAARSAYRTYACPASAVSVIFPFAGRTVATFSRPLSLSL